MPFLILASFPNSRIKPRAARSSGTTNQAAIPTGVATQLLPSNNNRTDLLIRNTDSVNTIYYGYDNTVSAATGFPLLGSEAVNIQGPQSVWIFQATGAPVTVAFDEGVG